ncbi:MAG: HAD-IB family hydrolase [Treponema sp.]|jgi:HAD superfamily hydrolase (TIGR01490 family)|nr:HAD-IB family hydrolase [Treponema sp.]
MTFHVFDVDYTLIKKSSSLYFLLEVLGEKLVRFEQVRGLLVDWLRYRLGRPNMDFIEEAIARLAGLDQGALEAAAKQCFETRIKKNIYVDACSLVRAAQDRGEPVVFASSTLKTILDPVEAFFGVQGSVSSELAFADGKTTGRLVRRSLFGGGKKAAVDALLERAGVPWQDVAFYSDSYTDLPLLEAAGRPVAVNPDRFLRRIASRRGWETLRFTRTLGAGR